jgi:CheY-like chemotaxis protein
LLKKTVRIVITKRPLEALFLSMGSPYHVLAVEDDVIDARFIERAGIESGLFQSLRVLGSGEEAQVYLRGEEPYADRTLHPVPNLLLLDLKLRRMSGLDFLRWVRQSPALRHLPVVVLSGVLGAPSLNRAYELGIEAYLMKPIGVRELSTTLAGVLVTLANSGPPVSPAQS